MNNPKLNANFFKKFSKFINNLLEKNLNKLNVDNIKNLLINNKIFLSIVALIILFLSYLSFPNLYIKEEVAAELKKNLRKIINPYITAAKLKLFNLEDEKGGAKSLLPAYVREKKRQKDSLLNRLR